MSGSAIWGNIVDVGAAFVADAKCRCWCNLQLGRLMTERWLPRGPTRPVPHHLIERRRSSTTSLSAGLHNASSRITMDQKVGGSNPFERAKQQVKANFLVPLPGAPNNVSRSFG